jgi:DNA-binding response OmpR family regulator
VVTILIAEDNAILARSIARRLAQCGVASEVVGSVAALRRVIHQQQISALCLDLQLPDGDGLDALETVVRPLRAALRVVVVTGTGTDEDRRRALRNGAVGFLIKPFPLQELMDLLLPEHVQSQPQMGLRH